MPAGRRSAGVQEVSVHGIALMALMDTIIMSL